MVCKPFLCVKDKSPKGEHNISRPMKYEGYCNYLKLLFTSFIYCLYNVEWQGVTPIQVQLQQFQSMVFKNIFKNHQRLHRTQIQNSLFFVVSGGNDIFSYFLPQLGIKPTTRRYVLSLLKQVVHFTTKIYLYGGRRIVLFSLGPISCIPGRVLIPFVSSSKCHVKMRNMADQYNAGLKRFVNLIPKLYPGAIGIYAAVYDTSKKFFENPKVHGTSSL